MNFPQFIVIHTVKGFGIVNKAEIDVFLELSCFFQRGSVPPKNPKVSPKIWIYFHIHMKIWIYFSYSYEIIWIYFSFLKTKSIPLCHKGLTINRCTIKILKYNPKAKCTITLIFDPSIEYLPFILLLLLKIMHKHWRNWSNWILNFYWVALTGVLLFSTLLVSKFYWIWLHCFNSRKI